MNRSQRASLAAVLEKHRLHCGAILAASGSVIDRHGDFDAYGGQGLVSALLGPAGDPAATFGMTEGQLLPRILGQGRHFAFVDKVGASEVAVLFGTSDEGETVSQQYVVSKDVHRFLIAQIENARKAAQPGATDNPDDAQRLREDH